MVCITLLIDKWKVIKTDLVQCGPKEVTRCGLALIFF